MSFLLTSHQQVSQAMALQQSRRDTHTVFVAVTAGGSHSKAICDLTHSLHGSLFYPCNFITLGFLVKLTQWFSTCGTLMPLSLASSGKPPRKTGFLPVDSNILLKGFN